MRQNRFDVFSASVLQAAKAMQAIKSQKLAQYNLKGTNALCLFEIYDSQENGLSATELARRCDIDKAQVSRCMKELIDMELVYRNDREGRRYKQKYMLTEQGIVVARDLTETSDRIRKQMRKDISVEDIDCFYRVLDSICKNCVVIEKE